MVSASLKEVWRYNVDTFKRNRISEISGSLGDLGTFLPIAIALSLNGTVSLASTLIFSGIYNILTGLYFGIPLPVQPMKAIAAVAISRSFQNGEIAAAGFFVATCILFLSASGLLQWFAYAIPIPVIKGIQVGAGLSLVISAATTMLVPLGYISPSWADNRIWAIVAFIALTLTNVYHRVPYALIVFIVGLVFALILTCMEGILPKFEIWSPVFDVPDRDQWWTGALDAGVGQLPLTTLNSVVAVVHLSNDLLPQMSNLSITHVGLSVSAMNLIGCWFGAMPVCHGSGGLAAQYRFGARSGSSIIFLGVFKLIVGLLFGNTLLELLKRFPAALLGVMVVAAGLELINVGESLNTTRARDLKVLSEATSHDVEEQSPAAFSLAEADRKRRWTVMMVTVGLLLGFKNDAVGFLAGMLCHWAYEVPRWIEQCRARWSLGRVRL